MLEGVKVVGVGLGLKRRVLLLKLSLHFRYLLVRAHVAWITKMRLMMRPGSKVLKLILRIVLRDSIHGR